MDLSDSKSLNASEKFLECVWLASKSPKQVTCQIQLPYRSFDDIAGGCCHVLPRVVGTWRKQSGR